MFRRTSFFAALVALLAITACSRWQSVVTDTPWVSAGYQAKEERFRHRGWNQSNYDKRWIGPGNKIYDSKAILAVTEEFLLTCLDSNMQKYESFQKIVVAIEPTIVIMVPSQPLSQDLSWPLGDYHPVRSVGPFRTSGHGYDYGSLFLYNKGMMWFSPDLSKKPETLAFGTDGKAAIILPSLRIELSVDGKVCRTIRK